MLELIRSLRRTTRDLEEALSGVGSSRNPFPSKTEAPSGFRRRVHSVLIVAEDNFSRALLVERLLNAGLLVEWASDPDAGREKAHRSAFDVVIVDQAVADSPAGDIAPVIGPGGPRRPPPVVLALEPSLVGRGAGRSFTVAQWRDSAGEVFKLVVGIMRGGGSGV
jgi:hypothetical protein